MKNIIEKLKGIRYQKFVTTFLYVFIFVVIGFTFWEYNFVGESVGADVYSKTLDTLTMLLGITGGLKGAEVISDTVEHIANVKYTIGSDMRGE